MPTIRIQGLPFTYTARYSPGHVLTSTEADVLNATLADRIRNAFTPKVKEVIDRFDGLDPTGAELEALHAAFSVYQTAYAFSSGKPRPVSDPLQALAESLAREAIGTSLRSQGKTPGDFPDEWFQEHIISTLESDPRFFSEARRRLTVQQQVASAILGSLED